MTVKKMNDGWRELTIKNLNSNKDGNLSMPNLDLSLLDSLLAESGGA